MITGLGNIARKATIAVALGMLALTQMAPAHAQSRIKDIADFEGVRDNMLVGYGLVVGLNGTGDDLGDAEFTRQSMVAMLERLGINVRDQIEDIDSDNIAAVMVTATLPPFSRQGSRIDVSISAIGTSESLQGGTLLVTPMVGADGEVYAVAQGNLAVGGFSAGGNAETVVKGVPTSARPVAALSNVKSISISIPCKTCLLFCEIQISPPHAAFQMPSMLIWARLQHAPATRALFVWSSLTATIRMSLHC